MVLFSIVIPYYNSGHYLDRLFITLADYFDSNCEIIIVDDCSKPEQLDKLKKKICESKATNIILKCGESNRGAAFARQLGVECASGEFIAFLDSDDGWLKEKCFRIVEIMKKNNLDIVGGTNKSVEFNQFNYCRNEPTANISFVKYLHFTDFLFKNYYSTTSVLVRRDVFFKYNFNTEMRYAEDYECWRRISHGARSGLIKDSGAYNFKHSYLNLDKTSLSASTRKMSKAELHGLYILFKNRNIELKYKILLPIAILYSFFKALYRELRMMMISK